MKMEKVNRYTRTGKNGKAIICPHCNQGSTVYNFAWSALQCEPCGNFSIKYEWLIPNRGKND